MRHLSAIFIIFLVFLSVAFGTTVLKMDLAELTSHSSKIVIGKVKRIFTSENKGMIYTYVVLNVEESVLDPENSHELYIVQPGGIVANKGIKVFGRPEFSLDERTLLFLNNTGHIPAKNLFEDKTSFMEIVGFSQGKYDILTNTKDGLSYIMQTPSNTKIVSANNYKLQVKGNNFIKLEDYLIRIKENLSNKAGK